MGRRSESDHVRINSGEAIEVIFSAVANGYFNGHKKVTNRVNCGVGSIVLS